MSTELWTRPQWRAAERAYLRRRDMRWHLTLKRALDLTCAAAAGLILLPMLLLIAVAVRLSSRGPVLFRQERLGRLGGTFCIYKFRTMVEGAVYQGAGLGTFQGDPRVTFLGRFLREYHLDELPQLFNVLRGDMSLVGPRPVLVSALPTYSAWERQRLLMPPGLTGWQQVNGGALNSVDRRIQLDVWYVLNWTPRLDLRILLRTAGVVLRKEGVYMADGQQQGRSAEGLGPR